MFIPLWIIWTIIGLYTFGFIIEVLAECCNPDISSPIELLLTIFCHLWYMPHLWYYHVSFAFKNCNRYLYLNDASQRDMVIVEYPTAEWVAHVSKVREKELERKTNEEITP